ncbi:MAG: PQQ-binding-like beta-propeller repeat protein [Chloroflexi bacterium]|nr:PQQ-binding-like beta-propeller repeat protein [Chloroflexota bacterium]
MTYCASSTKRYLFSIFAILLGAFLLTILLPAGASHAASLRKQGAAYITSTVTTVYAFKKPGGVLVWQYTPGVDIGSPAVVKGNVVYFGTVDGDLYVLNACTGVLITKYAPGASTTGTTGTTQDPLAYFASGDTVYAIDTNSGARAWQYVAASPIIQTPTATANTVSFRTVDGTLYVLNATTGVPIAGTGASTGTSIQQSAAGSIDPIDAQMNALVWQAYLESRAPGATP